jgi:hypothetical protein
MDSMILPQVHLTNSVWEAEGQLGHYAEQGLHPVLLSNPSKLRALTLPLGDYLSVRGRLYLKPTGQLWCCTHCHLVCELHP